MTRIDHPDGSYEIDGRQYIDDAVLAEWRSEAASINGNRHKAVDGGVVVAQTPTPATTTTSRYEGRRVDVTAILAQPPKAVPWRVRDLVADRTLTVVSGESGGGKSWFAMALCVGVARGHDVAGLQCSRGTALYIDGEMGPSMFVDQRMRPAGIGAEFELRDAMGLDLSTVADLAWLRGEIETTGAKLVVIDSLRRLMPSKAENDSDEMAPAISALAKLARDTDTAVVLVHHKGDSEKLYRGSTTIRDQCDALFALLRDDENGGLRRLSCDTSRGAKMRYAPEPSDVFLEIAPEHGGVVAVEAPAPRSRRASSTPTSDAVRQEILDALPCATKTEAGRKIGRTLNDRTFREAWAAMEAAGTITTVSQGVVVVAGAREETTTTTPAPSLALVPDARPEPCRCPRPLPAPDEDGDLRCSRCGHACAGWGVPA